MEVAQIRFVNDDDPLPKNKLTNPAGPDYMPFLYFPLSRFGDVINILRYEKPLRLFIHTIGSSLETLSIGGDIRTGDREPAGEQEL
jgi:hypothetical protein